MNNADLKNALLSGEPVLFNGMRYDCVSGIIYRRKKSFYRSSGTSAFFFFQTSSLLSFTDPIVIIN